MSYRSNNSYRVPLPQSAPANTYFQAPRAARTSNEAYQAAATGQAQKDVAAFGGLANLGIANQNALGQYGASRNAALANQSVASANAYGQMASNYYNTMGQLGHIGSALTAAGLGAGAQSGAATQSASMGDRYFGGGAGGGFGGGGGFMSGGPEGRIASGNMGGFGGAFGGMFGGMYGGGSSGSSATRGASSGERTGMLNQGYSFLSGLTDKINDPRNPAGRLAGDMGRQFDANRGAVMDPTITNSLNSNLATGYNALSNLYGQGDYGFNTAAAGQQAAAYDFGSGLSYSPQMASPSSMRYQPDVFNYNSLPMSYVDTRQEQWSHLKPMGRR